MLSFTPLIMLFVCRITFHDVLFLLMDQSRAVRAMNETLKQNRLLREQEDNRPDDKNIGADHQKNVHSFTHVIVECFDTLSLSLSLLVIINEQLFVKSFELI